MKTKFHSVLAAGVAMGAVWYCWWLLTMEPDGRTRMRGEVPAGPPEVTRSAAPVPKWPEPGTGAFARMALERLQPWLDARGRDATGLIAAWDITNSEKLLKEATDKYPDNPLVCRVMTSRAGLEGKSANLWAERFIAADPRNLLGLHLKAACLAQKGDPKGAISVLTQAAKSSGSYNDYSRARARIVREAARAAGMSEGDGVRLAMGDPRPGVHLFGPFERYATRYAGYAIEGGIEMELREARKNGDEERALEVIRAGLATAASMTEGGAVTLMQDDFTGYLTGFLLKELPNDTKIGSEGRTAGEMCAEVEKQRESLKQLRTRMDYAAEILAAADDETMRGYAEQFEEDGEVAAVSWLIGQRPPGEFLALQEAEQRKKSLFEAGGKLLLNALLR